MRKEPKHGKLFLHNDVKVYNARWSPFYKGNKYSDMLTDGWCYYGCGHESYYLYCKSKSEPFFQSIVGVYSSEKMMKSGCVAPVHMKPKKGDTIWIHPSCRCSRKQLQGFYKVTSDPTKADYGVIPSLCEIEDFCFKEDLQERRWLFYNSAVKKAWIFPDTGTHHDPDIIPMEEERYIDYLHRHEKAMDMMISWSHYTDEDILNSTCVFEGKMFCTRTSNTGLFYIDAGLLKGFVLEDEALGEMMASSNVELTKERVNGIASLMRSPDPKTVELGIRTLASLNWIGAPSVAMWLLKQRSLEWHRAVVPEPTREMKKMYDSLGERTFSYSQPFRKIGKEEWEKYKELIAPLLTSELEEAVAKQISSITNLNVRKVIFHFYDYSFKEDKEETQDNG